MGKHRSDIRAKRKENIYKRHNDERPWRERFWEAITLKRRRNGKVERARYSGTTYAPFQIQEGA